MLKRLKLLTIILLITCAGTKDYIKNDIEKQVEDAKVVVTESVNLSKPEKIIINSALRSCQATINEYSQTITSKNKEIADLKAALKTCAEEKDTLQKEKADLAKDAGFTSNSRIFLGIFAFIFLLIVILIIFLKLKGLSINPLSYLGK